MSCEVQLFKPKEVTKVHRHTSTAIYHVFRGQGRTRVGEGYLDWKKGDTFVVPLWQWHSHEQLSNEEAVLFSINDRPVMESLQLYHGRSCSIASRRLEYWSAGVMGPGPNLPILLYSNTPIRVHASPVESFEQPGG
jgi:hypothetical protein